MSRFIGDKRIENKTEEGDRVTVIFKDGSTDSMSKKLFELSATRDPINPTALWDKQLGPVTADIFKVLIDWDIKMGQLEYLFTNFVQSTIQHNNNKAQAIKWGKPLEERRMSDLENVLKQGNGN